MKLLFSLAFILPLAAYADLAGPVGISRCNFRIQSPGSYILRQDLRCGNPGEFGIEILNTKDVTLNLNGRSISGEKDAGPFNPFAVNVQNSKNVVVETRGARLGGFTSAFVITRSQNVAIRSSSGDLQIVGGQNGMSISFSKLVQVSEMQVQNLLQFPLYVTASEGVALNNISVSSPASKWGAFLVGVTNSTVSNFNILEPSLYGFILDQSANVELSWLQVNAVQTGIQLDTSSKIRISASKVRSANFGIAIGENDSTEVVIQSTTVEPNEFGQSRGICKAGKQRSEIAILDSVPAELTECPKVAPPSWPAIPESAARGMP